ncbi:MAG TPA: tRNA (N(6)-L-threonylcarbamoyladenosine(37)-C(2))-methylthiotransferase MtaB [Cyanobacteria bacterium UBA10660]|nr:MAG TPA: tRNA (N(6)-L-threonylcarbamoyladenosine(37)-C(2))-methylthiotransferase MtaB [Candidatus Gastranaerophilales bacterium HUM_1]HAS93559.1 tRNA (N(6)-L-threonylcarbamoyladenosine(37)-C(2))-methylthiotransferase MtaB [Cyanobacteria bacterium UBA10660]
MKKFNIHTMGCKSNQFESAIIEENLIEHGYKKVQNIEDADIYILNSCSVTHKSDNEAMYLLRSAKHKNPNILTIATGCMAQIEKEELLKNDFIDFVIGNDEKLHLYDYINSDERFSANDILKQTEFNKVELFDTTKTRASLKIQDGCDNRCTYCIIWKARGKSRSADSEFIVNQINNFAEHGFKEVMLTGIHIGQWGKEFGLSLLDLLKEIEEKTTIERYRLGSLNPPEITDEMLEFLKTSKKFCPHFHLSLQSANDKTLRSMNRFYKTEDYLKLIEKINETFENPFLGSDVIAGFAGETEEDFEITRKNLLSSGLTQIHTFPYSKRKGTIGAEMENQVPDDVKNSRATIIKEISKEKLNKFIEKNLGKTLEVLIEKHPDKHSQNLKGMTRNYLTVQIPSDRTDLFNTLQMVKLVKFENGKIYGELV